MVVGGVSIPVVDEGKTRQEKPTPKEEARLRRECYRLLQEMNVNLQEMNDKLQRLVEQKQVSEKNDQWLDDEQRKYECDCGSLSLDQAQCSAVEITAEVAAEHTTPVTEVAELVSESGAPTQTAIEAPAVHTATPATTVAIVTPIAVPCEGLTAQHRLTSAKLTQQELGSSTASEGPPYEGNTGRRWSLLAATFPFDPGGQWAIFDPGGLSTIQGCGYLYSSNVQL